MHKINVSKLDMEYQNVFFTSDTHFSHSNIIKYCNRPFERVDDMNEVLTINWNNVVGENDIVIHCGDFCFGDKKRWTNVLSELNGNIILVQGNHDNSNSIPEKSKIMSVHDIVEVSIYDEEITDKFQTIVCCHYPMLAYNGQHRGYWQVYGHVHSGQNIKNLDTAKLSNCTPNQYDVGVDNNNYTPISYEELKVKITKQNLYAK